MSDERKPVMCPWCGGEMQMTMKPMWDSDSVRCQMICGRCGAASPKRHGGKDDQQSLIEAAYAAATATPPNLPLTLPALFELEADDAAWVVSENGRIWAMGAECAQEWASEERCLFFASKPTNADIAAARKEQP